ncbi:hypothetical protein [Pedobacter sandarakinus]|uniref:hypothetical protein n=1 Tax=Pedobacter sandarakinus TaxID=353156 RepID=UPI002246D99C|nr:hypothetical protein [Pedobacter sandarakinus]MCX2574759.1 hypothetical protein [Pedobacter sandarakinus]
MKQTTILYVGRDTEITVVMNRLLNARPEWKGICVCADEQALEVCKTQVVDLVLLGNGIAPDEEEDLKGRLKALKPDLKIIQHYGGGSGLLYGEIMVALG